MTEGLGNIADVLSDGARRAPNAIAVLSLGVPVSYEALDVFVWRLATHFAHIGVSRGEVVAVGCASETTSLAAVMAVARVGASALTLPIRDPYLLRAETARRCGARRLVTDVDASKNPDIEPIVIDAANFATASAPIDYRVADTRPEAPWLITIGSGSTGLPKRIDQSHRVAFARAERARRAFSLGPKDRILCSSSFEFTDTKYRFFDLLAAGGAVVVPDRRRDDIVASWRSGAATILSASVVHLERALAVLPAGPGNQLPGVRVLRIGSSVVTGSLRERVARCLNPNVHIVYGTNEFGLATVAYPAQALARPDTVGKPVHGVELQVVDAQGRPCPPGIVGQIRLRGEGMVDGYVDDDEASRQSFRDGWFYSGDLGTSSVDGELLYRGRTDLMMICDGINVYPLEIEQVLLTHPAVIDATALPIESRAHQHIPVCVVVRDIEARVGEAELLAYARERLGPRSPWRILAVAEIPRTEQGKVRRDELLRGIVGTGGGVNLNRL